jgi:pantetheine-phosphate adenylyltransferase
MRTGFYPGSFDPVTFGHLDVIARSARLVDKLIIGVGAHAEKKGLLSSKERVKLLDEVCKPVAEHAGLKISVVTFDGLAVAAAKQVGANIIIRGLRDATDFDYEIQMGHMNAALEPGLETVFLAASPATRMIASSLVKQIAQLGGDTSVFIPKESEIILRKAISQS